MSEETVIRCCAPTLAAIKTGSLFNCPFETREELTESLRMVNRCLIHKDVRGFMEHRECKCTGLWKVFESDEAEAQRYESTEAIYLT